MYYSHFHLNTYRATPYFVAHVPEDFPVDQLIAATPTFHDLPPRLRRLAELSRAWGRPHGYAENGIDDYYDAEGYELDPATGQRATRAQVLEERGGELPPAPVADIPEPPSGFADPATWEPAPVPDDSDLVDRGDLTLDDVISTISTVGRDRTAEEYGVPKGWLANVKTDRDLAELVLGMDGKPWPEGQR